MEAVGDFLAFVLFCAVLAATARIAWAYLHDQPLPRPSPPPRHSTSSVSSLDRPDFQARLMRLSRATAASLGRGSPQPFEYVTPSGNRFLFTLARVGGDWRVYIDSQPSYGGRAEGGHDSHRYVDDRARPFICWDGQIDRLDRAIYIAAHWALLTERYIATGRRF